MEGKGDLAFSLAFEVIPTFELKDVSGIELTRHVVKLPMPRSMKPLIAWPPNTSRGVAKIRQGCEGRRGHHLLRRQD